MKKFAFYLPQFHPHDANDKFWGEGFTDWWTTRAAQPLFSGHIQPKVPGKLGEYTLTDPQVIEAQAKLARDSGFDGFAIYNYWFGKDNFALESPIEILRKSKIEIEYFVCWVNGDWTKSWIGDKKSVIHKQIYDEKYYIEYFNYLKPYLSDARYYRINFSPVIYIHNPSIFDFKKFMKIGEAVLGRVTWIAPMIHVSKDDYEHFTYLLGYPPGDFMPYRAGIANKLKEAIYRLMPNSLKYSNYVFSKFRCFDAMKYIAAYTNFQRSQIHRRPNYVPTILLNWDNTPRYSKRGFVIQPKHTYDVSLMKSQLNAVLSDAKTPFIMVKAWNEWAEGNYLEPDENFWKSIPLDMLLRVFETSNDTTAK